MVTSSEASKFIYRDESVPPLTPFEVKVGVYNNKGDGPFSQIVVICSAEGGQFLYPYYLHSMFYYGCYVDVIWMKHCCTHELHGRGWGVGKRSFEY